jgi:hypothetical protein
VDRLQKSKPEPSCLKQWSSWNRKCTLTMLTLWNSDDCHDSKSGFCINY